MSEQEKPMINWKLIKIWAIAYAIFVILYLVNQFIRIETLTPKEFLQTIGNIDGKPLTSYKYPEDNNPEEIKALEEKIINARNEDLKTIKRKIGKEIEVEIFKFEKHGDEGLLKLTKETEILKRNIILKNKETADLALNILADLNKKDEDEHLIKSISLVKENAFTNFWWEEFLTLLNTSGIFIILYSILGQFLTQFLQKSAETQAKLYEQAGEAEKEAESLSKRKAELEAILEAEKQNLIENEAAELEKIRRQIINQAEQESKMLIEMMQTRLNQEMQIAALRLRQQIAQQAIELANQELLKNPDKEGHDKAVDKLVSDIKAMNIN